MRGTRARQAAVARERGIIPAYAGNTMRSRTAWPTIRDHPRVCGEHPDPIVLSCAIWGSSPRMRGTLMRFPSRSARCGIIPAYAGNTYVVAGCASQVEDHPRVCGEHIYTTNPDLLDPGSSPRMRGTLADDGEPCFTPGIIPAYAGNTGSRSTMPPTFWDHPRVCGEHPFAAGVRLRKWGSSPRMRGTPRRSWMISD